MNLNTSYYNGSYAVADTPDMKKCKNLKELAEDGTLVPNEMIDMSCYLFRCVRDPLTVSHFIRLLRAGDDCEIEMHQNVQPVVNNYSLGQLESWSYGGNDYGVGNWQYTNTLSLPRIGYSATSTQIPTIAPIVECKTKYLVLLIRLVYKKVNGTPTTHRDGCKIFSLFSNDYHATFDEFMNDSTLRSQLENGSIIITSVYATAYYGAGKQDPEHPTDPARRPINIKLFPSLNGEDLECTIWDEYTDGVNAVKRKVLLPSSYFSMPNINGNYVALRQGGNDKYLDPSAAGKNIVAFIPYCNTYFWNIGYTSMSASGATVCCYIDSLRNLGLAFSAFYATGLTVTGDLEYAKNADLTGDTLPAGGRRGTVDPDTGDVNPDNPTDETTGTTDDPTQMHSATGWEGNIHIDPNVYVDTTPLETPAISTVGVFNRSYAMSFSQISALADELWNADDSIFEEIVQGLALLGECPMQGLIDLRLYPFNISAVIGTGDLEAIRVGRTTLTATGIKLGNDVNAVIDLGSCTFFDKFQNFLDYSPYTEARLYIPYCGIVPIDTAEFMGKTITAKMIVDVVTGACEAFVYADQIIVAHANGNIGVSIPMTGDNAAAYSASILSGIVGGTVDVVSGALSGSVVKAVGGAADVMGGMLGAAPTQYAKAGSASSACSMWMPQYAYFIIDRPVELTPQGYGHTVGYACEEYGVLSSFSGYTVCKNVDLTGISATEAEKDMIRELLEGGFYV